MNGRDSKLKKKDAASEFMYNMHGVSHPPEFTEELYNCHCRLAKDPSRGSLYNASVRFVMRTGKSSISQMP